MLGAYWLSDRIRVFAIQSTGWVYILDQLELQDGCTGQGPGCAVGVSLSQGSQIIAGKTDVCISNVSLTVCIDLNLHLFILNWP